MLALACQGESLWLGTAVGLQRFNRAGTVPSGNWPRGEVVALASGTGGVWAAVRGTAGYEVGFATVTGWLPLSARPLKERVAGLAPAGRAEVWIATDDGLALGSTGGVRWYQTEGPPEVIPVEGNRTDALSNLIQALAVRGGALWIGAARGLFRMGLTDGRWYGFTGSDRLADVRAILPGTGADDLWVAAGQDGRGGAGGLRRVAGDVPSVEQFPVPASILGLAAGVGGAAWAVAGLDLGPLPAGLYRGDEAGWSLALAASELRGRSLPHGACLQTVSQAPDGRAWIGTSAGLFAWQPGAVVAREASLDEPDVRVCSGARGRRGDRRHSWRAPCRPPGSPGAGCGLVWPDGQRPGLGCVCRHFVVWDGCRPGAGGPRSGRVARGSDRDSHQQRLGCRPRHGIGHFWGRG